MKRIADRLDGALMKRNKLPADHTPRVNNNKICETKENL